MYIVGLTGGIATGKTTVVQLMKVFFQTELKNLLSKGLEITIY
jgi:dephospho-CoA kinase